MLVYIGLAVVCLLPSAAFAVVPAPDGGYPGFNTAEGTNALLSLTTGQFNTALGGQALRFNTTGASNTAVGVNALLRNSTGAQSVAVGQGALGNNTTGGRNVAVGFQALASNTTAGNASNAVGFQALLTNTTGLFNNAFGWRALFSCLTGDNNSAFGDGAGVNIDTGNNNTCLGANSGTGFTTASNSVAIGLPGSNQSGRTWIRNANVVQSFSAGVNNYVTVEVATGRIGMTAVVSSRRYKHDIKPMDNSSEALFRLKPVTFRLNKDLDEHQLPQWGLIAEDVEKVNPDLISRNYKGEIEAVRYDSVNAMLLNEFLKEHKRVEAQQATIAELKVTVAQQQKGMEVLTAQLKEQASQIQKVSAQLELKKRAPRTVANK